MNGFTYLEWSDRPFHTKNFVQAAPCKKGYKRRYTPFTRFLKFPFLYNNINNCNNNHSFFIVAVPTNFETHFDQQ